MTLSQELIKNFVEITDDSKPVEKQTIINGTVSSIQNGEVFVRIDGSEDETPVGTVSNAVVGDRVKVSIINHVATIDGNLTSPSARYGDLQESEHKLQTNIEQTEERIKLYASETYQVIGDYATNTGLNNVKVTLESTIQQTSKDILLEVKEDYQPIGDYATNDAVKQAKDAAIKVAADAIVSYVKANGGTTTYTQTSSGFTWTITKVENGVDATARADAIDGRKVATNYLAFGESKWGDGLVVGDLTGTTLGGNVQIVGGSNPGVNIREGSTIYSKFIKTGMEVYGETTFKGETKMQKLININPEGTYFSFFNDSAKIVEHVSIGQFSKACVDCDKSVYNSTTKYQTDYFSGLQPGIFEMNYRSQKVGSSETNGVYDLYFDVKTQNIQYTGVDDKKLVLKLNGWSITNGLFHSDDIGKVQLTSSTSSGNTSYYMRPLNEESTVAERPYYYLGGDKHRWKTLYIYNSAIETSDRKRKTDIEVLNEKYIDVFDLIDPVSYKFKGGDRLHTGFIAQDVEDAMNEVGLTIEELGLLCKDLDVDDDGNPILDDDGNEQYNYGLRYGEFVAILSAKIKQLEAEIKELKGE